MTDQIAIIPLRALIDDASSRLGLYKNPDISELHARLGPIFKAAGKGGLVGVRITGIDLGDEDLVIDYAWSARGCSQEDIARIPAHIIDADDPLQAANRWRLETEIESTESEITTLTNDLATKKAKAERLRQELAALEQAS